MKGRTIALIVLAAVGSFGLLTVGCCGGLLYWGYSATSADISPRVDRLFEQIDDGTFVDTYDTDTTAAFRRVTTREQYANIGNVIKNRLGALQSKTLASYNARQHNASSMIEAQYNGKFAQGNASIAVRYVRAGDDWKLEQFNVDSPVFDQDWATAKCPHCGAPHAADARFCPACGKEFPGAVSAREAGEQP